MLPSPFILNLCLYAFRVNKHHGIKERFSFLQLGLTVGIFAVGCDAILFIYLFIRFLQAFLFSGLSFLRISHISL